MPSPASTQSSSSGLASAEDVSRLLCALDERKTLDIVALRPTLADVEQAAVWLAGDGDVIARSGHPLAGVVAEILDILAVDDEEPPRTR
jgi:hypothetical protein